MRRQIQQHNELMTQFSQVDFTMCLIIHILSIVFLCFTYYFCLSECFCPFLVFLFRFYTIVIYLIITVLWSNGAEYSSVQLLIVSRSDLAHIEHDIWPLPLGPHLLWFPVWVSSQPQHVSQKFGNFCQIRALSF